MSDSGNARIAAIWPLKAAKKTDWVIVPVDSIKDFKEKKNYGQQLYKYKGPGDKKSSLVFILLTGCKLSYFSERHYFVQSCLKFHFYLISFCCF